MKVPLSIFAAGLFLGLAAPTLSAAVILVDFGLDTQQSGGNWNNVSNPSNLSLWTSGTSNLTLIPDLKEFNSGLATSYGLTISVGGSSHAGIAGGNNAAAPTPAPFILSSSRDSAAAPNGAVVTFRVTGLDQLVTYDFSFLATINTTSTSTRNTSFTINGNTQTINALNNSTLVQFNDIAPDVNGVIAIGWRGAIGGTNTGFLNGFSITYDPVPEPASATLAAASLGFLAIRRRRRRK